MTYKPGQRVNISDTIGSTSIVTFFNNSLSNLEIKYQHSSDTDYYAVYTKNKEDYWYVHKLYITPTKVPKLRRRFHD
jgi:hypothetical protein